MNPTSKLTISKLERVVHVVACVMSINASTISASEEMGKAVVDGTLVDRLVGSILAVGDAVAYICATYAVAIVALVLLSSEMQM